MTGYLTHTVGNILRNTGWSYLLHLPIILRVIIEELIACHYFGNREQDRLIVRLIDTLSNLSAFKVTLDHYLRALHHRLADGGSQLVFILHFRYTKRRTVSGRFHKAGHADALFYFIVTHQLLIALADQQ